MSFSKKIIIAVYVMSMFIVAMDATIINVALSTIGEEFNVPVSATSGVNIGYLVSLAMLLPVAGWLGDRFGSKRMLMLAVSIFTIASLCCGWAQSQTMLNVCRVLQGAGAGLLTPVGMSMLFRTFTPEERPKLSRVLVVPVAIAPALGPVVGGYLVDQLSWRWIFYLNIPIGVIVLVLAGLFIEEYKEPSIGRFDVKGFLLSLPGFGLLIYALIEAPILGWAQPKVFIPFLIGLAFLLYLVKWERKIERPMLNLSLFKDNSFRVMSLIGMFSAAGLFGMLYVFPLLYQNVLGFSAFHTGLTTFPEALGLMVASQLLPWSMKKLGVRRLMLLSLLGSMIIFSLIALLAEANPWLIRLLMFGVGIFLGHAVTAAQISAFQHISKHQMSQATTLHNVQKRFGGVFGVALLASIIGSQQTADITMVPYQWALGGSAAFIGICFLIGLAYQEQEKEQVDVQAERA
ncbi:DHA2 family efflux MFS transporter permease subunit [Gracilibacillus caseinilyticus]|uniref:DHA2 family efflux MFS transporter permease subunit n=1 Tax=Gracilibacillus caseinilyticus TaxID=2932256 RepID=A0ABY4EXH2_9BACI|nr:DHA2 family efflux MFS transporter permease subunit [Gracilibacillus caseinilyticus]UOQ48665.1 DHA2 family efflux MFS transporter permease subunit [Gracilibacillus caseinilyticus]